MAVGIIRMRSLSSEDISSTEKHNARLYESKKLYPKNIDPNGKFDAEYYAETPNGISAYSPTEKSLENVIQERIKKHQVKGIRKNSTLALEYVCTINDKNVWDNYSFSGFVSNTEKWLEDRHGKCSVVATYKHEDESNPHVHFIIVPVKKKTVKWKNQNGAGTREEARLNAREFTTGQEGGRKAMRQLQNDYHSHLIKRYGEGEDNKFGTPLFRGTLVENQTKEYQRATNHELGVLRDSIHKLTDEALKLEKMLELKRKEAALIKYSIEKINEIEKTKELKKNNWKERGTKDNPTIFHTEKIKEKETKPKRKSKGI